MLIGNRWGGVPTFHRKKNCLLQCNNKHQTHADRPRQLKRQRIIISQQQRQISQAAFAAEPSTSVSNKLSENEICFRFLSFVLRGPRARIVGDCKESRRITVLIRLGRSRPLWIDTPPRVKAVCPVWPRLPAIVRIERRRPLETRSFGDNPIQSANSRYDHSSQSVDRSDSFRSYRH